MEDLYDETVFEGELPVWFVVAEGFTEVKEGRRTLKRAEPLAFCGADVGGARCVAIFTDEDLATRHAEATPGTVSIGIFTVPGAGEHLAVVLSERL